MQGVCVSTASSMTCRMCAFLSPAVWTCRVHPFFKCRNVRLSSIQSVRYRNERKCRCQNQSGTRMREHSSLPESSGTGLRYRMLECRCLAMVFSTYTSFVKYCPSNLLSPSPPSPFPVSKCSIYLETIFCRSLHSVWPDSEPSKLQEHPKQ